VVAAGCKLGVSPVSCQGSAVVIDNSTMSGDGPVTTSTDCVEEYGTTYQVGLVHRP